MGIREQGYVHGYATQDHGSLARSLICSFVRSFSVSLGVSLGLYVCVHAVF